MKGGKHRFPQILLTRCCLPCWQISNMLMSRSKLHQEYTPYKTRRDSDERVSRSDTETITHRCMPHQYFIISSPIPVFCRPSLHRRLPFTHRPALSLSSKPLARVQGTRCAFDRIAYRHCCSLFAFYFFTYHWSLLLCTCN
ncbi:hypothetical protein CDAR_21431 [Caerostris darwini]|uniref:Uncharacterized protein n=1 Tax=Caerostris darwini TaxID=1538125 RepID=A0AAV4VZP5_9ARAC|nr:hypothetical protein CDAR_21431 [Caerostris darwini]